MFFSSSVKHMTNGYKGPSWSWSYGSWIYNYLCNQCLSPLKVEFESHSWRGLLDTTFCDTVCQWLATGQWFSPVTLFSSTNIPDCQDRYSWNIVESGVKHHKPANQWLCGLDIHQELQRWPALVIEFHMKFLSAFL